MEYTPREQQIGGIGFDILILPRFSDLRTGEDICIENKLLIIKCLWIAFGNLVVTLKWKQLAGHLNIR
jgi:hypothetical protein